MTMLPPGAAGPSSSGAADIQQQQHLQQQQQQQQQLQQQCANCVDLLLSVHIECVDCAKHGRRVVLCVTCFSMGAECGEHKRTHAYRVIRPGGVAIFGCSLVAGSCSSSAGTQPASSSSAAVWSSAEEVALVEAAERYNLGNWDDVGACVNAGRAVAEVKEHYDRFYLRGRIGQIANKNFVRPAATDHTESADRFGNKMMMGGGLTSPPLRSSVQKIGYDDLRLLAYMPNRDDFEKEWNNEAEELVSKLLPAPDDDELDKAVKLAHVDMYVRVVAERRKRKAMARDYDLVHTFFKQEKPGAANKAWKYTPQTYQKIKRENELREQLKKISQLIPAAEFNEFVHGLAKQDLLKERIEELQKLRKSGVTTLEGEEKSKFSDTLRLLCVESAAGIDGDDENAVENSKSTHPCTGASAESSDHSASMHNTENSTIAGIEYDAGRRSSPRSQLNPTLESQAVINNHEQSYCASHSLDMDTYLLLKMYLLKEQLQKAQGVPMKANIRQDLQEAKTDLKMCMKRAGWLPAI